MRSWFMTDEKKTEIIRDQVRRILEELPPEVTLIAAAKGRTAEEINVAVQSGVAIIGENYVSEAKQIYQQLSKRKTEKRIQWHFIGVLGKAKHDVLRQKNLRMFDMIETVDSFELAEAISEQCGKIGKTMPILIEVNSGEEPQKAGILPEQVEQLVLDIADLSNVRLMGLMTMGPRFGDPENSRPYFIKTKKLYERIKSLDLENVEMNYLSMGMTNSYKIAIEEGANMVRIGTKIFGERKA